MLFNRKKSEPSVTPLPAREGPDPASERAKPTEESPGSASPSASAQALNREGAPLAENARRQAAALRNSLAFTQIVGVLMRSQHYKHYTLADLEWLVVPPMLAGQYRIGEVKQKQGDAGIPVAVVMWASVSPDVDKRLMDAGTAPIRLRPDEWKSGDILWLVHAVGEPRFVQQVLKPLIETTFNGRAVKVRGRGQDGQPTVHVLPTNAAA
jgi:hemolysin-activating ACP:hemolysin acyltransferase